MEAAAITSKEISTPYGNMTRYSAGPCVWFNGPRVEVRNTRMVNFGATFRVDHGAWYGCTAEYASDMSGHWAGPVPPASGVAWPICQWLTVHGFVPAKA